MLNVNCGAIFCGPRYEPEPEEKPVVKKSVAKAKGSKRVVKGK